ncbi:hypothetical protein CJF31_00000663 [Rutstroemia sp. NJR-2017a BVV2]|nr:hypothetical protein CJF31_00000663 [Rutstroemia sp. NJR-2017a BVV2]
MSGFRGGRIRRLMRLVMIVWMRCDE